MDKQASLAALGLHDDRVRHLSNIDKQFQNITESPAFQEEWNKVAEVARTVPTMPLLLQVCMDRPAGLDQIWQQWPAAAFFEGQAIMAAVELEAKHPKYLPLPPALAQLNGHPLLEAGRALGRCLYRDVMYFEDEETGEVLYEPYRFDRQEVVDFVDGSICPKDKRLAVTIPLVLRVGRVVGFLSGLAVAQPHEAQGGMVILAALVKPLLETLPPEERLNRAGRRAAARRVKSLPAPRKQGKGR